MRHEILTIYKQFFTDTFEKNMLLSDITCDIKMHEINIICAYDMLADFVSRYAYPDTDACSFMSRLDRWLVIINDVYIEHTMPCIHGIPVKGPSYMYLYDLVVEFLDYLSEISFWQLIHEPDPTLAMK